MPAIVRKSFSAITETRREVFQSIGWHTHSSVWSPPTDVYETEENYVIKIEVAGMRDEDFEVAIEDNVLRISGYRADLNERRAYHQMEIRFGRFEIAIGIPMPVDIDKATAEYQAGFLMILIPKSDDESSEVG